MWPTPPSEVTYSLKFYCGSVSANIMNSSKLRSMQNLYQSPCYMKSALSLGLFTNDVMRQKEGRGVSRKVIFLEDKGRGR